jgi:hypothetical protein
MKINKLKYGFVTVYNETVFLKQVKRDDLRDEKGNKTTGYVMYYSNPIHHNTVWHHSQVNSHTTDFGPHMTVRMGLWYLSYMGYELNDGGAPDIDQTHGWIRVNTDDDTPADPRTNVRTRGQE